MGRVMVVLWVLMMTQVSNAFAQAEMLSLPEGDPERGREHFMTLKCYACHRIAGDGTMPAPSVSVSCPTFGVRQSRYKKGFLADSIIFPSHAIVPGSHARSDLDGSSKMGDFSDSITVRQLADLVAYIKTLDDEV